MPERAIDPAAVETARQAMLHGRSEEAARRVLDSFCDPTRLKMVRALVETPLAASDLASVIGRSRSATSQHLRVLREAGAVVPARTGNVVRYRLGDGITAEVVTAVSKAFDALEAA